MRIRSLLLASSIALATVLAADHAHAGCTPGQQLACACANGSSGAQICSDDGSRFEACRCAAPAPAPIVVYAGRPPSPPAPPGRGLFNGGLAMTIIGGLLAPTGIVMIAVDAKYSCTHIAVCVGGGAMAVAGAGMIIGGIVLMIAGKNKEAEAATPPVGWIPAGIGFTDREVALMWRF